MAVLVALGSFITTLLGGYSALRIGSYRNLVLGLAAGLMLGAVGFDLLPEALSPGFWVLWGIPTPLLAFVSGFLVLHIVERTVGIHLGQTSNDADVSDAPGVGLLAAAGLVGHSVMDGFAIGAAFQAGTGVGAVVAVAVIGHDFADGFNTYTITSLYGNDRRRALTLLAADAVAPVAGAALTLAVTIPHRVLDVYLGFFAGFLMYLASADVLPRAHTGRRTAATLACTVGAVLFMLAVVGLAS
ncbi:ZIP family metal transporter [Mycobacterium shigaense]|uniref:ZIP family metal transporter n=1 Tax=Mycobacterium shigaense TaxID=722731 RepID=A0A1Z4EC24_9MYCO|nr:ZIP family metal transporter [Mycobacterium shigaense]MEA1124146.1 ZIP family metal transporter [Mycobacterium shigaense]PRI17255.1 permease [Mycobacterium shigaense]BAX90498.1 ZIP family metal transporter [Mycobacterium shigaense]